ncbi:hypothetical protein AB0B01_11920 [Streptomyces sp. NPDC044571]|uniref:hypothetical protein n=1 Tax=Streptomyces sp. NPDC044571 TaxID=3155371 RepID=UPI003404D660
MTVMTPLSILTAPAAPHSAPGPAPSAVLLVESPLAPSADLALRRDGVEVMVLRFDHDAVHLSAEYLARTADLPVFTLDTAAPLMDEAARYLRWVKGTKGLPRPRFLYNPDGELQQTAGAFASLVDLPQLSPAARELVEA